MDPQQRVGVRAALLVRDTTARASEPNSGLALSESLVRIRPGTTPGPTADRGIAGPPGWSACVVTVYAGDCADETVRADGFCPCRGVGPPRRGRRCVDCRSREW